MINARLQCSVPLHRQFRPNRSRGEASLAEPWGGPLQRLLRRKLSQRRD